MSKLKTTLPPAPTRSPNILEALPPEKAANVQGLLAPHLSEIMPPGELSEYKEAIELKRKMLLHVHEHDHDAARRDVKRLRSELMASVERGEDPLNDPHALIAEQQLEARHRIALGDVKSIVKVHNQKIHDLCQAALSRSITIVSKKVAEVDADERSQALKYGIDFEPSKTLLSLKASIRFLESLRCAPCLSHYSENKLPFADLIGI